MQNSNAATGDSRPRPDRSIIGGGSATVNCFLGKLTNVWGAGVWLIFPRRSDDRGLAAVALIVRWLHRRGCTLGRGEGLPLSPLAAGFV
jgi:hypothetical protein